ncbi:MAG: glycosyltransferase, partial [Candidatus Omnitrophota bacterium]
MKTLALMARLLGRDEDARQWQASADTLGRKIWEAFYDKDSNLFFDVDKENHQRKQKILTPASFLPLWVGIPLNLDETAILKIFGPEGVPAQYRDAQRDEGDMEPLVKDMIRRYLINPDYFFGSYPFPAVAYSEPAYEPGFYWRGPVWLNLAYFMIDTLYKYGFIVEADEATQRVLRMVNAHPHIYEYYNSQTGSRGEGPKDVDIPAAQDFSWSAALMVLMLLGRFHSMAGGRLFNEPVIPAARQVRKLILDRFTKGAHPPAGCVRLITKLANLEWDRHAQGRAFFTGPSENPLESLYKAIGARSPPKELRIALLAYSFPPVMGGVNIVMAEQAHWLATLGRELGEERLSVKVIAGIPDGYQEPPYLRYTYIEGLEALPQEAPINTHATQAEVIQEFKDLEERIYKNLKSELANQDVIIIHNVMTVRLNLPFTAALHRLIKENPLKHFVVYVHNAEDVVHDQYPLNLVNLSKEKPDNVTYVTVSDHYRQLLARQYGINPRDIVIINPGIHAYSALSVSSKAREIFHANRLCDQDLVLVFPTRVDWNKDITKAVEIVGALNDRGLKTKLVLAVPQVGSFDDFMTKLFEQLKEENEEKKQVFNGLLRPIAEKYVVFVDTASVQDPLLHRQLIMDLLALADFLVFPSWMETFGMPLLEAASVRTGIIASDLPSHHETMQSEAMLFDLRRTPQDIAEDILAYMQGNNFANRKLLQERILNTYTWQDLMINQFVPLLKDIIDGRPLLSLAVANAQAGEHEKAFRQLLNILRIAGHAPQKAGEVLDRLEGIESVVAAHQEETNSEPPYIYELLEQMLREIKTQWPGERAAQLNDRQVAMLVRGMDAIDLLQHDPLHTGALNQIGHMFSEWGMFPQAENVYLRVMDIDPRNTEALNGLARVYHKQGSDRQAQLIYFNILKIDAENRDAMEGLAELGGADSVHPFSSPVSESARHAAQLRQAERWLKSSSAFDVLKAKQRLYLTGTGFGTGNGETREEIMIRGHRIINARSVNQNGENVLFVPAIDEKLIWGTLGCGNCIGVIGARLNNNLAEQGYAIHQWHKPVWATRGIFRFDPSQYVSRVRQEFLEALRVLAAAGPAVFVIAYRDDVELPMLYLAEFFNKRIRGTGTKFLFIRRGDVAAVIGSQEGYGLMVNDGDSRSDIVLPWNDVRAFLSDRDLVFTEFNAGHLSVVDTAAEVSSPLGGQGRYQHNTGDRFSLMGEDSLQNIRKHLGTGDSVKGEGDRLFVYAGSWGREPVSGLCRQIASNPADTEPMVRLRNLRDVQENRGALSSPVGRGERGPKGWKGEYGVRRIEEVFSAEAKKYRVPVQF